MKGYLALLIAAAAAPLLAGEPAVYGLWQRSGAASLVRLGPCGYDPAQVCGVIEAGDGLAGRPMLTGMQPGGADRWTQGQVWMPEDDTTYHARMEARGGQLVVEVCAAIVCRREVWIRPE